MSDPSPMPAFFKEQKPAAVLKHGILRRYLRPFASKTGSRSPGAAAAYLDGYAGPGTYESGAQGSPTLAAETARQIAGFRRLKCFYIEEKRSAFRKLQKALATVEHDYVAYHGRVEEHLDSVLAQCEGLPLLAFLDPFGLGVPFSVLEGKILARSHRQGDRREGPPTEVLLNFSFAGLQRNAGKAVTETKHAARDATIDRLDATFGGEWWEELWRCSPDPQRAILNEYGRRLQNAAGGWEFTSIPVANSLGGNPVYELIFLTQHRDGLWQMAEAVSGARAEWERYCRMQRLSQDQSGQLAFDDLLDPERLEAPRWISTISRNIERLLADGKSFRVIDRMTTVYGTTFGLARSKHVRAAIIELHRAGKTPTEGKGAVDQIIVQPVRPGPERRSA